MIVKVQKPLEGDMTQVLVYNQDRSYEQLHDFNDELKSVFERIGKPKFYAHAEIDGENIVIDRIVDDKEW